MTKKPAEEGDVTKFKEQLKRVEFIPRPSLCCVLNSWLKCKNCTWTLCEECLNLGRPKDMYHYAAYLSHEIYGCKEHFQLD
jgi:hypothetical protein